MRCLMKQNAKALNTARGSLTLEEFFLSVPPKKSNIRKNTAMKIIASRGKKNNKNKTRLTVGFQGGRWKLCPGDKMKRKFAFGVMTTCLRRVECAKEIRIRVVRTAYASRVAYTERLAVLFIRRQNVSVSYNVFAG